MPAGREMLGHQAAEQRLAVAVERGAGLVEQPERARRDEEPGEPGPPPLAGGKDADRQIERMAEPDRCRRRRADRPPPRAIERGPEAQRLAQA